MTEIHTSGGPAFENFHGSYVAGNQIVLISGYSGEQLRQVLEQLGPAFAANQARLQVNPEQKTLQVTSAGGMQVVLSESASRALADEAAQMQDQRAYLSALLVHPHYRRWAEQFVPLAGQLTEVTLQDDLPPEFSLVQFEGEGAQARLRRLDLPDISQAFERHDCLALLGEPGAGKTTTLRRLALQTAQATLAGGESRLPLEIPLADYRYQVEPLALVESRAARLLGKHFNLQAALQQGSLLLLFDSLNEMPYRDEDEYHRKIHQLSRFKQDWPRTRMVFACRTRDYSEPLGLTQVEIKRLADERVQLFLQKYLPDDLAQSTWERLRASDLLELLRNPYYLLMFTTQVQGRRQWPANRAQLFDGFVAYLLKREELKHTPDWPGAGALLQALAALAEQMQPLGRGTRLPLAQLWAALPGEVQDETGRSLSLEPQQVYRLALAARRRPMYHKKINKLIKTNFRKTSTL